MMKISNLVTILCSTYNSAKWIDGYLESINNQFLDNFNIIFIDANSTDDSLHTIKKYKFRKGIDVQIVECDTKIPIYEAWNIAIGMAQTKYVINVNTDDRLYPAALTTYLNYAEHMPEGDVFYTPYLQTENLEHTQVGGYVIPPEHDHQKLLQHCYCGPFPLLKKSSIIEDGLFDPSFSISGDYEMWLRMSKKGRNLIKVSECLGSYYYNPKGMSTNTENYKEHIKQDTLMRDMYK